MASHPTQIPAGGRDIISVVVRTENRGGETLHKRFNVSTNDPRNGRVELMVSGKVKAFVTVLPPYVRLMGNQGETLQASIKIVPQPEYPLTIKSVRSTQGEHFTHTLKPLGEHPEREGYELTVSNTMREPGSYRDFIQIETDLAVKPMIRIPVSGRVFATQTGPPAKAPQ